MSTRQDKVAKQIQKDLAEILPKHPVGSLKGKMLTVTNVRITPDLGLAKVYLSIFPSTDSKTIVKEINEHTGLFRNDLGRRLRHQLKKVPELKFYLDDSLDYIENIENLLKK